MPKRYYEKDGNLDYLNGRTVAIIGYGSQGHAHALNLRDSGVDVVVGLYPGSKSWAKAEAAGLKVMTVAEAAKAADVVMILVSDHIQADLYNKDIAPHMTKGKTLMFAHGFNIHFQQIAPPADVDVSMVAPKAPGHRVRELYTEGVGVPALVAVHQDASGQASGTRAGLRPGARLPEGRRDRNHLPRRDRKRSLRRAGRALRRRRELIRAGFETLVEAGYAPEIAYFECLHELKLIVDLIQEGGLSYMRYSVSDTAEYGDYTRGPRIVNDADPRRNEEDSGGDPVRRIRPPVDRRKQDRPPEVPGHARSRAGSADRKSGPRTPRNDDLPQKEKGSRRTRSIGQASGPVPLSVLL